MVYLFAESGRWVTGATLVVDGGQWLAHARRNREGAAAKNIRSVPGVKL